MLNRPVRGLCLVGVVFLLSVSLYGGVPPTAVLAQSGQTTPTPEPTVDPFIGLSIPELAARSYGGGQLANIQILSRAATFTRYLISYPSDGLTIYGFMDVPVATPRNGSTYPVIVAVHGYISPAVYETIDYTARYADAMASAGYLVLHPNLRGYRPSDSAPNLLRVGFAIDVLNLIAIVRARGGQPGTLQKASATAIGLWGHSMGGGISIRAMTVDPHIRAVVLYSAISGDDRLNMQRFHGRQGQYDITVPDDVFQKTSPMYFYDRVQAAVSIHQGLADTTVPPAWSADLCSRLQALQKSVECFTYPGEGHTMKGAGDQLFIQRMMAFFDAHLRAG
ncbi:MAG TPA: alpha/beta fold hydrolase [Aggregatilineales bacterium]|nr:alpha/beta fold hydrolase [Aggregatilineales bacterium]